VSGLTETNNIIQERLCLTLCEICTYNENNRAHMKSRPPGD
jgi:hypothetical protein